MGTSESRPGVLYQTKNSALHESPNGLIKIGSSLEGLPLYLSINREYDVETGVLRALECKSKEKLDPNIKKALNALNESVTSYACTLGVLKVGVEKMYVSEKDIRQLLDDTLLCRILSKQSPFEESDIKTSNIEFRTDKRENRRRRASVDFVAGTELGGHDRKLVQREVTGELHLGIPLSDDPTKTPLITISRKNEPIAVRSPLQMESFNVFDAQFEFNFYFNNNKKKKQKYSGALNSELQRQFEKCYNDYQTWQQSSKESSQFSMSNLDFSIIISRNSVAKQILLVAKKLQTYHERGVIHGDINPSNILILPDGALPFDSFNIKIGGIAFAGTPGWASPDQILRKPVSPATDIYPLGLMLVQLVGGFIFGEEKTFIVPTSLEKTHRIKLVCDTEVFLDEFKLEGMSGEGRRVWKKFIEKCIEFDPEKRPKTAGGFAEELSGIMDEHPLTGSVVVKELIGELVPVESDGKIAWSRVLYDSKNSGSKRTL